MTQTVAPRERAAVWGALALLLPVPLLAQNLCVTTHEGLSTPVRLLLLGGFALSALLLYKGGAIKTTLADSKLALRAYHGVAGLVFTVGIIAVLHNVVVMRFYAVNTNMHPAGSACERFNPGPCFRLLGDTYCLKRPPVTIDVSTN